MPPAGPEDFRARRPGPDRGSAAPVDRTPGLRPGPTVRRLGTLSARAAVLILLGATLLGAAASVVTHKEPGGLLGFFVILGAIIAALVIQRRRLHVLIPLPALALFCGAVLNGAIHDRHMDSSTTQMGVNFLQWIAGVFFPMCIATILVLVIAGARWLLSRQLVAGQFRMSEDRGTARGPRPAAAGRAGGGRPARDSREGVPPNRDPWGNRGAPPDRDPWGGRRDNTGGWGANSRRDNPNQRGDRPSFNRDPRNDQRRPSY